MYKSDDKKMIEKKEIEAVFRQHYEAMFRLARRMLGDEAEGKDVVSEVFASLLDGRADLHSPTLRNYLLTCVRNRCTNLLTRQQLTTRTRQGLHAMQQQDIVCGKTPSTADAADEVEREEQLCNIRLYVEERLPELSQKILRLRYQQGLKYREIADALNVSEVTVYHHLTESLKRLKEHFKSLGYGIK